MIFGSSLRLAASDDNTDSALQLAVTWNFVRIMMSAFEVGVGRYVGFVPRGVGAQRACYVGMSM